MATEATETKGRILKAAVQLFSKFGFRSISMDDIAHQLGMSKKTVYQYFADKDEIVTLAIKTHLAHEKEALQRLQADVKDAVEFFIRVNNYLTRNIRETSSAAIFDLKKYHARAWENIEKFRNEFLLKALAENLTAGITQGYFRSDMNINIMSRLRLEEVTLMINRDIFPQGSFDLAEVSSNILDHFVNGIVTESGRKLYQKYKKTGRLTDDHFVKLI